MSASWTKLVIDVRAATPDEADVIADINVRSWRHAYRGIIPDSYLAALDHAAIAHRVREAALNRSATILVAGSPEVHGFSWVARSRDDDAPPETAEIIAIYVAPSSSAEASDVLWLLRPATRRVRRRSRASAFGFSRRTPALERSTKRSSSSRTGAPGARLWGGIPIREVRYVRPL